MRSSARAYSYKYSYLYSSQALLFAWAAHRLPVLRERQCRARSCGEAERLHVLQRGGVQQPQRAVGAAHLGSGISKQGTKHSKEISIQLLPPI